MSENFQSFLKLATSKYLNQYIVIIDKKVVANGKDIVSMLKSVRRKYPGKTPLVAKIPEKSVLEWISSLNLKLPLTKNEGRLFLINNNIPNVWSEFVSAIEKYSLPIR